MEKILKIIKTRLRKTLKFTLRWFFKAVIVLTIILNSLPLGMFPWQKSPNQVLASTTLTKTTQADWQAGRYENKEIDTATSSGDIKLALDLGSWDASGPANLNHYSYTHNKMLKIGQFLYVFRNRGLGQFLRYDFDTKEWKDLAYMPLQPYEILDATTNNTDTIWVFATRTSSTNLSRYFLKYDIPTNTWSYLANTPAVMAEQPRLEYAGNNTIYAIRGRGYYDLWRYNATDNSWDVIQNTTVYCQTYCDLVYDGHRYIYYATDWQNPDYFYRFDTTNRTWLARASLPIDGAISTAVDLVLMGNFIYTMRGNSTTTRYRYNITSNTWQTSSAGNPFDNLPYLTYYGAMATDSGRIITQIGISEFIYYYPDSNTWSNDLRAPLSNALSTGKSMESDGAGNFYFCRGQNTTTCYKYVVATNTWSSITAAPATLGGEGTAMAFYNNALYVARGSNGNSIYRYNVGTNDWTSSGINSPASTITTGGNMMASASGTLWALQGGGATGFYRYNVGSNTWTTMTAVPEGTYRGSGMVQAGMYTYVLQGYQRGRFWRYHETTNGWYEMPSLPVGAYHGGSLVYDGSEYIYAFPGGDNDIWGKWMYRFSISKNAWERVADTPEIIRNGAGFAWYSGKIYAYQGYDGGFWKYTPSTGANVYTTSGTWYSPVYDLTYATNYNSFSTTETVPENTTLTYFSRTSDNQNTWSSWELIDSGAIASTARRYIQIKAVLTGNGTTTPTLSGFTIDYDSDVSPPETSSISVTGLSTGGGTALTTGGTYTYPTPYFSWTGATDTETGLEGYYVYYGSNASADPISLGAFQYTTNYQVGTNMVAGTTYYLLIKAKDKIGNISDTITAFTYTYNGVSPATTRTVSTQGDFEQGVLNNLVASTSAWWNTKYLYRQQITVNNSSTSAAFKETVAKISTDTASLVSAGKMLANGNDLRIAYFNGTEWFEAKRSIENMNTSSTDIYFTLPAIISASGSDNNYYLYYGNSQAVAPTSSGAIADEYTDNSINTNKWLVNTNYGTITETSNQMRYTGRTSGQNGISSQFRSVASVSGDFTFETKITIVNNTGSSFNGGMFLGTYDDATPNNGQGVMIGFGNGGTINFYSKAVGGAYSGLGFSVGYTKGVEYKVKVQRIRNTWYFYRDGAMIGSYAGLYSGNVYFISLRYWKESLTTNWQGDVYFDNTYFNSNTPTTLTTTLGIETDVINSSTSNLRLTHETDGNWAANQIPQLPWESRMNYGAAVYARQSLYVLRGYNTRTFYQVDLTTATSSALPNAPANIYNGSTMVYDGVDTIYVSQGNGGYGFYKYSISNYSWTTTLTQPTVVWNTGAAMIMVGTNTLYAFAGGSVNLLRYTINTDTWDNMSGFPYTTGAGSGLAYNGTDAIYAVAGAGSGFAKYIIATDTWDNTLPLSPYSIGSASNNLIYYNNYLYTFTTYDYEKNTGDKHFYWRYNIATNKWEMLNLGTDFWLSIGAVAYDGSRYAYLMQGYNTTTYNGATAMTRFDLQTHQFTPKTPPLPLDRTYYNDGETLVHMPWSGTSLTSDQVDNIYFAQGATSYINKFQVSTNKWSMLPYSPCTNYGSLIYASSSAGLFNICGNTTKLMYKYDSVNNSWTQMADAPDTIGAAGSQIAAYDGNDALYVVRGRGTRTLYKYSISTNTWTTQSNPGASPPDTFGNSMGATVVYDGQGNLYIARGNNTMSFYRYNISSNTWTIINSVPGFVYDGSAAVYDNGKIYMTTSNTTTDFFIYDTFSDTWSVGNPVPSKIYAGGAMTKGPGNTIYGTQGNYTFTFWKYNLPTNITAYKANGTFYSPTYDLGTVYNWAGLSATIASPSATSITFETRSSTDSANWSSWTETINLKKIETTNYVYNINSPVNRYLQIKTTLSTDEGENTPTISNINISYYADESQPNNPDTLLSYKTSTKAATINNNTWYNNASPYFEWSGAGDATGSGVLGYYVYFGQNQNADPFTLGAFQTAASYSASLSQDGEYYLNIKTKDNAGNISATIWQAFHYRYDGTAPNAVGTVSVDPRIYTTTNNFSMGWSAITDITSNSTSSGLLAYYYSATSAASLSDDIISTATSAASITAYQVGENTFRIKSKDIAGNESSYTTATFYYNSQAPSPPTELAVDTSNAGANKFMFTWAKPTVYLKGAVKEYRYSINVLPAEGNISTTSATAIGNQRGTKSGTNTFYVVAVDEADNVDYANYASIDFEVDITAPGIPLNPESFDNSIRNTKSYRVGITWDKPTDMGSAFDRYEIYAADAATTSAQCSTSMDGYSLVGTTAGTSDGGSYVVTSMNNQALESTTYNFCVLACSSSNQCSGPSTTVDELPTGRWLISPDLTASPSATVKTKTATITWSTSRTANSFVKYGTKSGDYGMEVGSSEQVTAHEVDLTELAPGTTYYYKVIWADEDGNQGTSDEQNFVTNPAPSVASVKISSVSLYSAYVSFTIKNATKASIQYGKTLSYGSATAISTSKSESTQTILIDKLTEGTVYHLRIVAEDEEANTFAGDDYTFETLPVPKITGLKVQQVAGQAYATIRLIWSTNTPISSIVTYYPEGEAASAKDQISLTLKKNHEMILKNLKDDATYSVTVKGRDTAGNEATSVTQSVKTSVDLRAPEILNMNVESTIVGIGSDAKAQIIVSWDTDEPATTQVEYAQGTGTSYGQSTQEDTNMTTNHTVTVTGLTPSKIYHLRALSKDKVSNVGQSFDTVVITPKSTKDALNLVVDNLSKTFGFLKILNK